MHKPESIREFIERRSKGKSCSSIAEDLEISRSTLFAWNAKSKAQILAASSEQAGNFHCNAITDIEDNLNLTSDAQVEVLQSVRRDYFQLAELPIDRRITLLIKLNKEMDRLRFSQHKHIQALSDLLAATPETASSPQHDPSNPSDNSNSSPENPETSPETVQKLTTPTPEPPQPQELATSNPSPEISPEIVQFPLSDPLINELDQFINLMRGKVRVQSHTTPETPPLHSTNGAPPQF